MNVRVAYDEFSMFHENAAEHGIAYAGPPTVRREQVEVAPGRHVSSLVWGVGPPEVVLVHGGGQNAHTWDTVALALGRPLVAIDPAGHGHSDTIGGLALDPDTSAPDFVVRAPCTNRLAERLEGRQIIQHGSHPSVASPE